MKDVLGELIELIKLKRIDQDRFVGESQDLGFPHVFGGQVLGQALSAASATVEGRHPHSLHAYFLLPGDVAEPIDYQVDRIRDGKSFTTRLVVAVQKGRPIFNMSVSFQVPESGFDHQQPMPQVKGPEGLLSDLELARKFRDRIPEKLRVKFTCERPIEFRTIGPIDPFNPQQKEPIKHSWLRTVGQMPDDPLMHAILLSYASDYGLLATALLPHQISVMHRQMQAASLDHCMWFHRDFRIDDWLLYAVDSPSASAGRGFSRGLIYDRAGQLVASVVQEGLIRFRPKQ